MKDFLKNHEHFSKIMYFLKIMKNYYILKQIKNKTKKQTKKLEKLNGKGKKRSDRKTEIATKWVGPMRLGVRGASLPRRSGWHIGFHLRPAWPDIRARFSSLSPINMQA
jgi:hypothetical protein